VPVPVPVPVPGRRPIRANFAPVIDKARAGSLVLALWAAACRPDSAPAVPPEDTGGGEKAPAGDYQAIYDDLEAAIAEGRDSEDDRQQAMTRVREIADDGTAAYAFARAAIVGRVAELRGVKAGKLVTEAEQWAKASIDRDPEYRQQAASRMIGSLWVMAPPRLVEHGDSEEGLELLESLAEAHPEVPENGLRAAEAYLFLGDTDPAIPHLCRIRSARDALRPDDRALFDKLAREVGGGQELPCGDAG
jgi:hypothetical protein